MPASASGDMWARCLLSGLHVLASLAACGSLVAVLLQWAQNLNCLPPTANVFGDPVSVGDSLTLACDLITYSSAIACALNLGLAVLINCCWGNWCCAFLHQILTVLVCLVSVGSGSALTVDFILWCNSLQNHVSLYSGCQDAAEQYDDMHDSSNMTAYYRKMEMQQACQWAVVPFTFCAIVVYSIVMKSAAQPRGVMRRVGGRYFLFCDASDETSPLISTPVTVVAAGEANDDVNDTATAPPAAARPT